MVRKRTLQKCVSVAGSPSKVSLRYDVSVDHVYGLIDEGIIPAYDAGFVRKRLIFFDDFERWLRSTRVRTADVLKPSIDHGAEGET